MKALLFKYNTVIIYLLGSIVVVLSFAALFLYRQQTSMVQENRFLILQNDSILSENIELKNQLLQKQTALPVKKQSLTSVNHP